MSLEFLAGLWLRLKALLMKRKLDRDLEDELRFHMEMRREKLEKAGVPLSEASASARPPLRQPRAATGNYAFAMEVRMDRRGGPRSPVRLPHTGESARFHGHCGDHAGFRNRRQYSHLLHCERHSFARHAIRKASGYLFDSRDRPGGIAAQRDATGKWRQCSRMEKESPLVSRDCPTDAVQ